MFRHNYKYSLLSLCVAAGFMTACSSSAIEDNTEEISRAMTFHVSRDLDSRALTSNDDFFKEGNKFAVWGAFALQSKPGTFITVFDAQPITYTSSVWTYSPTQYWFPGNEYNFLAIHPAELPDITPVYTPATSTLEIQGFDLTKKVDLLSSTYTHKATLTGNSRVSLDFRHNLVRIQFTVTVDPAAEESIIIDDIRFYGVRTKGDFNLKAGQTGTWSNLKDVTTSASPLASANPGEIPCDGQARPLFTGENCIVAFPGAIPSGAAVRITYHYESAPTPVSFTANVWDNSVALAYRWNVGQSYNYRFTLGTADKVIFEAPEVTEWEDYEGGNYIIQ